MTPSTIAPTQESGDERVQKGNKVTIQMVRDLYSDSVQDQLEAARQFRQLISRTVDPSPKEVIDAVSVSRFVDLLQCENNCQLQHEAAWVLCNIASSISPHTQAVVSAGAVPILIRLISSNSPDVRQTATWALGNIAGDSSTNRDLLLAQNILTPLLQMLEQQPDAPVTVVSWVFRNLCGRHKPPPDFSKVAPCLPALCRLVFHSDEQVSDDACWALTNISRGQGHQLKAALDPDFGRRLVELHRENPYRRAIAAAVKAVGKNNPDSDTETKVTESHRASNDQKREVPSPSSEQIPTHAARRRTSFGSTCSQTTGKRRSRSPSPGGVSTRNTPKKIRKNSLRDMSNTPMKQRALKTRGSAKKLMKSPDHSASYISQIKAEIFKAVEVGEVERVEELVQDTGPTVTRVKTGCTLLHVAAANNQPDVVLFLLKLINPNVVNKEGQTPAHVAAMKGHTQVLRILLADQKLNHDKRDNYHNTYKDLLTAPLFEAILDGSTNEAEILLKLGADPDYRAKQLVHGVLARELQVTTARQLALTLQQESIIRRFPQKQTTEMNNNTWHKSRGLPIGDFPQVSGNSRDLKGSHASVPTSGPDVYRMDSDSKGYVCILNYSSFKDRPDLDLEGSHPDVLNLANVFGEMGYTGHAHLSLTADQTQQVLTRVRDAEVLDQARCAIFIISSHGIGEEAFLTSDMKLLTTEWVHDLFKDSECPRLKNKPKIFIFDFCCGYYKEQTPRHGRTGKCTRVEEPLRDVMCLYSSSGGFTSYSFSRDGTPFTTSLCCTLAQHAHDKEFSDLYREFLKEYTKTSPATIPQLRNIGFNKRFYFSTRKYK